MQDSNPDDSNWLRDRNPADHPSTICDEEGCWCLLSDGKMRMCFCQCHNRTVGGTPQSRKKWNGKDYR